MANPVFTITMENGGVITGELYPDNRQRQRTAPCVESGAHGRCMAQGGSVRYRPGRPLPPPDGGSAGPALAAHGAGAGAHRYPAQPPKHRQRAQPALSAGR